MIRFIIAALMYVLLATASVAQKPAPVHLSWTHSTDNVAVTGYNIYRDGSKIGTTSTTTYTDTTVAPTTQYSYTVSAFDAAGNESDTSMPYVIKTGTIIILPPGGDVTFTPTALRFMAPGGHDTCNGQGPSTGTVNPCAWATPNHAMNCGDVVLFGPGDYSATNMTDWGVVSNCPSPNDGVSGIDGTGGIWFAIALCAGSDVEACHSSGQLWQITNNNWAVEGMHVTNPSDTGANGRGFNSWGCAAFTPPGFILHHHAFINNVAVAVSSAFHTDDCGQGAGTAQLWGVDYWAVVGNIAQNASRNTSTCEAAIDAVGPQQIDTNPGTHIYIYNNYTWHNQAGSGCAVFDSEAIMFDAWNAHSMNVQGVIANNMAWTADRYCVHLFSNGPVTITPTMKVYNNTCYNNLQNIASDSADGELNMSVGHPWAMSFTKNIARATFTGSSKLAMVNGGGTNTGVVNGGTGNENILKSNATGCPGTCDAGNNEAAFNANPLGTNFYVDPAFNNTADLISNRDGAPDCTGFKTTTACMGWNVTMGSLTVPSVISDLTANCAQCAGKGFQRPSPTCAANADYPTWLKGIVRLEASGFVSGATITEKADLVTKPCNM